MSDRWAGGQELGLSEGKLKWEYELRFKGHADGILIRKVRPLNLHPRGVSIGL